MEKIITKSFARLMGRGVHRGFITYEELSKSLGKRNLSDQNLSQAFIHILDEKITVEDFLNRVRAYDFGDLDSCEFLDSPSAGTHTYFLEWRLSSGSATSYINRSQRDQDADHAARTASTITVMEIAA